MHKKRLAAALLALVILTGCAGGNDSGGGQDDIEEISNSTGYLDTLTPGIDYYGYMNGKDLYNMEFAAKYAAGGSTATAELRRREQIDSIVTEIAESSEDFPKGSNEQIVHDMYHLIKDQYDGTIDTDAEDTALFDELLGKIDAVQDVQGLKQLWRDLLLDYGINAFLTIEPEMNEYNTSEYIFVSSFDSPADLENIKESDKGAVAERDSLADTLRALGISTEEATNRATDIIYVLHGIASHTDMDILNQNKGISEYFNVLSTSEISGMLNNLSTDDLFFISGYTGDSPDKMVVYDPEQLRAIDSFVDNEHIGVWKDIAIISALTTYSNYLPKKYNLSQLKTTTGEMKARAFFLEGRLRTATGELYAEHCYDEKKRENITKMCEDMRAEYRVLISGADWLSEEGRAFLLEKLNKMELFIGADKPHEIDPADADFIESSLLKTMINLEVRSVRKCLEQYGTVPSRNGFEAMGASTMNACFVPDYNCINITAAITNAPLYDENFSYYENLGRIGTVIGHEISHAFDSNGVLYDADGNLRPDAMPEEDIKAFAEIQKKAIKYYDKFTVLGSHVNGKLTLTENLADISGLQCALAIAATPENQKILLESHARLWMNLEMDTLAKDNLDSDVHAPNSVRLNAVVACFDEFYDIYGVKEGDPMYVAPEERVRRW